MNATRSDLLKSNGESMTAPAFGVTCRLLPGQKPIERLNPATARPSPYCPQCGARLIRLVAGEVVKYLHVRDS